MSKKKSTYLNRCCSTTKNPSLTILVNINPALSIASGFIIAKVPSRACSGLLGAAIFENSILLFVKIVMCVFFRQQLSTFYILVCNKVCMACRNIKCDCKDCLSVVVIKTAIVARYITHSGRFWKILSENYMAFLLLSSNSIQ